MQAINLSSFQYKWHNSTGLKIEYGVWPQSLKYIFNGICKLYGVIVVHD